MLSFIIRRLLIIIPMALLVVTLTWVLIRIAPGNFYSGEKKLPAAVEANIRKKYGLDKPWYEQYGMMMSNIVRGDFGDSLKYQGQSVNEIIRRHLPYSATIGILAYFLENQNKTQNIRGKWEKEPAKFSPWRPADSREF